MIVTFIIDDTPEEVYRKRISSSLRKAKHLSDRAKNFIDDIEKSKYIKEKDKKIIKDELLKFIIK